MHGVSQLDIAEEVTVVTFGRIPPDAALVADIFGRMASAGINIDMVSQSVPASGNISISFTCRDEDLRQALDISRGLREKYPQVSALASSGNCKLQLFGEEMRTQSGVFAKAMAAMADAGVELQLITTSEVDISLLLPGAQLADAKAALTAAFGL